VRCGKPFTAIIVAIIDCQYVEVNEVRVVISQIQDKCMCNCMMGISEAGFPAARRLCKYPRGLTVQTGVIMRSRSDVYLIPLSKNVGSRQGPLTSRYNVVR